MSWQKTSGDSGRFSTTLAKRFAEDLILDGKQPGTVDSYRNVIAHLAEFYRVSPDQLTEQQIRQYLIGRRKSLALNSMRPILGAIKFLYRVTLPRDWPTLRAMRLPKSRTVPKVLLPEQCWQIIDATKMLHLRAAMTLAFTCGFRSIDVRNLKPAHIDAAAGTVHVVNSKGNHQRSVPIAEPTIEILREYWATHRNPSLIFPSRGRLSKIATVRRSISARTLQRGMEKVTESMGLADKDIVFHTLRHSYATAMLDEGCNLKVLSMYLGHKNLLATEPYLHLTRRGDQKAREIVDRIFDRDEDTDKKCDDKKRDQPESDVENRDEDDPADGGDFE